MLSEQFEFCLKNYFWIAHFFEGWCFAFIKSFNFILVTWGQTKCVKPWIANYPMKCYLNELTYIKQFSFFSWIRSSLNEPFFLPWVLITKFCSIAVTGKEYRNVWNNIETVNCTVQCCPNILIDLHLNELLYIFGRIFVGNVFLSWSKRLDF